MVSEYKRTSVETNDVLDRVLDKGKVIDAAIRIALVVIDFVITRARLAVASIETYLKYAGALAATNAMREMPVALAHSALNAGVAMTVSRSSRRQSGHRTAHRSRP